MEKVQDIKIYQEVKYLMEKMETIEKIVTSQNEAIGTLSKSMRFLVESLKFQANKLTGEK
jgi:hypothetical protein